MNKESITKSNISKRGKNYQNWKNQYWTRNSLSLKEILNILQKNKLEKFDSTINLTFHLNLNTKKPEHNLKGHYTLPHNSFQKEMIIAVFSKNKQDEAKEFGAQIVGGIELIEEIQKTKKINFDVALATPEIAKDLTKIAKILGPKKIMPSSKNGTINLDIEKPIQEYQKGKRSYHANGSNSLQFVMGKISDSIENLVENYNYVFEKVVKIKPNNVKGKYIKAIHISGTMSPNFSLILSN